MSLPHMPLHTYKQVDCSDMCSKDILVFVCYQGVIIQENKRGFTCYCLCCTVMQHKILMIN